MKWSAIDGSTLVVLGVLIEVFFVFGAEVVLLDEFFYCVVDVEVVVVGVVQVACDLDCCV